MHQDKGSLTQQTKDCIAACFACSQICNTCSDDMIGMQHEGNTQLMERCIRLCREGADLCALAAQWMSRVSPLSGRLCRLCAEVCEMCAESCEHHAPHHALCGPCARECRRCAELLQKNGCRSKGSVVRP